jgi:hypothetical protein
MMEDHGGGALARVRSRDDADEFPLLARFISNFALTAFVTARRFRRP